MIYTHEFTNDYGRTFKCIPLSSKRGLTTAIAFCQDGITPMLIPVVIKDPKPLKGHESRNEDV